MLHDQESVNLTIYLYAQTMGQRRMLYIRKFYVVKNIYFSLSISIHRWDTGTQLQWRVTNMARNDLRARGGGARSATPTASIYIYIYIYIYISIVNYICKQLKLPKVHFWIILKELPKKRLT